MIERAAAVADEFLTPAERAAGGVYDPAGLDTAAARIRSLVAKMDQPGMRHTRLEDHVLQSLADLYPEPTLDAGMILLSRTIAAGYTGAVELRFGRARLLLHLGRELRDDALLFNAWGAIGAHFESRGNFPRTERASLRSMKYARRTNDPRLIAQGYIALGVLRGFHGDYANSVRYLWRAYRTARHPKLRTSALVNLAETLYRAGQFRASRAARAVILQGRPSLGNLFITLGGYAVCCSALGDVRGVKWAANQLRVMADKYPANRGLAQGLLGAADGCGEVGLNEDARALYERGMAIAEALGYHDLRFRPDPTRRLVARAGARRFVGEAGKVRDSIVRMAPHGVAADYTPVPA